MQPTNQAPPSTETVISRGIPAPLRMSARSVICEGSASPGSAVISGAARLVEMRWTFHPAASTCCANSIDLTGSAVPTILADDEFPVGAAADCTVDAKDPSSANDNAVRISIKDP